MQKRGFTLIELLVVISIIALLSSIVIVSLSEARAKARDARRVADLKQIQLALELYKDKYGIYPGLDDSLGGGIKIDNDGIVWNGNYDHDYGYIYSKLLPFLPKTPEDPKRSSRVGGSGKKYYLYSWRGDRQRYHLGAELEMSSSSYLSRDTDFCSVDGTDPSCNHQGFTTGYRHFFDGRESSSSYIYDLTNY